MIIPQLEERPELVVQVLKAIEQGAGLYLVSIANQQQLFGESFCYCAEGVKKVTEKFKIWKQDYEQSKAQN